VVPAEFLERFQLRKQYIGQLELLAAVAVYLTFPDETRGRRVLHWIDNTSALAALIKGYARAEDSARIVQAFHAFNLGLQADAWFEYVASKANIADLPSRGEFAELERLRSTERPAVMPAVADWFDAAEAWIERATATAAAGGSGGERRRPAPPGAPSGPPRRRRHRRRARGVGETSAADGAAEADDADAAERPPTASFAARWVVDWRRAQYDVYVGRASRGAPRCDEVAPAWGVLGRWGNEFAMRSEGERDDVVEAHRRSLLSDAARIAEVRRCLRGRVLGCWCGGARCHADNLAEVANCDEAHLAIICEECAG
jgi:hypothetical protein